MLLEINGGDFLRQRRVKLPVVVGGTNCRLLLGRNRITSSQIPIEIK
jgi:hypothetical protein